MKLTWYEPPNAQIIYQYVWTAEHATEVYFGKVSESGVEMPARMWVHEAVEREFVSLDGLDGMTFEQAAEEIAKRVNHAFQDAIALEMYDWPRRTLRSDGTIADSPRNIVDTGALLNSQEYKRIR